MSPPENQTAPARNQGGEENKDGRLERRDSHLVTHPSPKSLARRLAEEAFAKIWKRPVEIVRKRCRS